MLIVLGLAAQAVAVWNPSGSPKVPSDAQGLTSPKRTTSQQFPAGYVSLVKYCETQKKNLGEALRFEPFAVLISAMHNLYEVSVGLILNDNFFGQFVLMEHSVFLGAASLIGQAQPYEAMPITRRAIEMARVAAALKEDPKNAEEWVAFKQRHERWQARQRGEKPKRLNINLKVSHPTVNELMEDYGILSDSAVHFTPEHFASLGWEGRPGMLYLNYFIGDQRTMEREIILLVGTHAKILKVLNDCLDGAFSANGEWTALMAELEQKAKPYVAKFQQGHEERADDNKSGTDLVESPLVEKENPQT